MRSRVTRHLQAFFYSLGQLVRSPGSTFMTVAVIGITLALPTALYAVLDNARRVSGGLADGSQVSVFLKVAPESEGGRRLLADLRGNPRVGEVQVISAQAALQEFRDFSGLGDVLAGLEENPLPSVYVVRPRPDLSAAQLQALVAEWQARTEVDRAQMDLQWVRRLGALLELAQRAVLLLGVLLAIAVVLIVGNTVRLAVLNRREEIEIISLVGGTPAFIRRPFLYSGTLQGVFGAIMALLLVGFSLEALSGPVQALASLYGTGARLEGLDAAPSLGLVLGGGVLGWLASRIAVDRHLRSLRV
ncbi:MAG: permease-like cell division protein FtsX [Gammaproteobacteria bacterium]|nr:permease-like cell division protein FtsX [Gammaproteobacteria bacterium]